MSQPPDSTDKTALFVTLLANSERRLAAFVFSLVPNFTDADEVLQETKIRLWEQFDSYDHNKSFDAWARSIAYYQVLTYRKKAGREKLVFSTDLVDALNLSYSSHERQLDQYTEALESCLKELTKKNQLLLSEVYRGCVRLDDIARAFEMTVDGIKKALYRSRSALHKCITRRVQSGSKG